MVNLHISASLQADLAQAHAEKASLEEELASARLTIERQQRQSKHEVNRLNSEVSLLRSYTLVKPELNFTDS